MTSDGARLREELRMELLRFGKALHVVKVRLADHIPAGLDAAAVGVLMNLVRCGPRRQGALAEVVMLDPSTASRHVAQLVRAGLVERRPDPDDGRAVQLAATPTGQRLADEVSGHHRALVHQVLGDWPDDDLATFLALLRRFDDQIDNLRLHPRDPREHREPRATPTSTQQER
jgi:DNA-binding MarR family transcriptional regulator